MFEWNSAQYLKFEKERTQPAIDLAVRISIRNPKKIADIGCGPGNSTNILKQQFPDADILGVDNSSDMIQCALKNYPDLRFQICDAQKELDTLGLESYDIVFSNACIQWIPDHHELLKNMFFLLKPHGILAIQTPMNYEEPIHKIIKETVAGDEWKSYFPQPRVFYNLTPGEYYDLFAEMTNSITLWQTTYYHILPSHEAIMEWYRGTGLRPYLSVLSGDDKQRFETAIFDQIVESYPLQENGSVIFRFPRFFMLLIK